MFYLSTIELCVIWIIYRVLIVYLVDEYLVPKYKKAHVTWKTIANPIIFFWWIEIC